MCTSFRRETIGTTMLRPTMLSGGQLESMDTPTFVLWYLQRRSWDLKLHWTNQHFQLVTVRLHLVGISPLFQFTPEMGFFAASRLSHLYVQTSVGHVQMNTSDGHLWTQALPERGYSCSWAIRRRSSQSKSANC